MVERVTQISLDPLYRLRVEFANKHGREGMPTGEQIVSGLLQGAMIGLLLDDHAGYAIFHPTEYNGVKVIWIDEIYLTLAARKHGRLKEFADWLKEYCRYNGIATIMGTAFDAKEAEPFLKHLGAEPVCMILRVNAPSMTYRPTEQAAPELALTPLMEAREPRADTILDVPANGTVRPRKRRNEAKYPVMTEQ